MEIELESKTYKPTTRSEAEPLVHSHIKYTHPKKPKNTKQKNKIY